MATVEFTTEELASEEWRPVVGHEGRYEVSSLGRLKSLHFKSQGRFYRGRAMAPKLMATNPSKRSGYVKVTLCRPKRNTTLHILVAAAFLGPRPEPVDGQEIEVNHKDGIKTNCRESNLEYITQFANGLHAKEHGLLNPSSGDDHWTRRRPDLVRRGDRCTLYLNPRRGSDSASAKLTETDIPVIRAALASGRTMYRLAKDYGVGATTIRDIKLGVTWRHVT